MRGAAGLRCAGMAVKVSDIGSIPSGRLLDEREAGDAVERIGLHFEPGIGDFLTAERTDSVGMRMQGHERLLDSAKLFDGEQFHGQGDIDLMLGGGLVDRIWEEFRLCRDQMRHHGFVCKHPSKSIEFVLKVRIIPAPPHVDVRTLRWNNSTGLVR